MIVQTLHTPKITAGMCSLTQLLDEHLAELGERSVLAISSKVAALCENRVVPIEGADKDELIRQQATLYLPRSFSRYNVSFTIAHHTLAASAGIDETNGNGMYVLWPEDPQATANMVREYLGQRFGLQNVGVILTDSTLRPLRWGVTTLALAASGFEMIEDYIGRPDLFGRPMEYNKASIQDGLATAAGVVMGEGEAPTPLAVITDIPFVKFTGRNPTEQELQALLIEPEDDLYGPFLTRAPWETGEGWQR